MIRIWILAAMLTSTFFLSQAFAQTEEGEAGGAQSAGGVSSKFAAQNREAGFVCGAFLPNQIDGVSELMSLCGGRVGFKLSPKTTLEPQLVGGAARAQRYILGSVSFRGDIQVDDIIGSIYGGGDIHYATSPVYSGTSASGEETKMYFGAHIGGAVWWECTDNLFLRTDLQFNVNPGTSLFVGFSLVLRFSTGGGGDSGGAPGG